MNKQKQSMAVKCFVIARNFFTHYNKQRYNEPSVQEVLAANRVLRYVLLSIGIESTDIKACNHFEYSTLSRDIEVILKNKKDAEYTSWSE